MNETITVIGGRIVEGVANGMSFAVIARRLGRPEAYIKKSVRELSSDLDSQGRPRASTLSVSRCIAAGLLRAKDLTLPGQQFTFTMEPNDGSLIGFRDTYNLQRQAHVWPRVPVNPYTMPRRVVKPFLVSPQTRTIISCISTGMSLEQLAAAGYIDFKVDKEIDQAEYAKRELRHFYENLDVGESPQAVAYAALLGVIDIGDTYLTPTPEPIKYTEPHEVDPSLYSAPLVKGLIPPAIVD